MVLVRQLWILSGSCRFCQEAMYFVRKLLTRQEALDYVRKLKILSGSFGYVRKLWICHEATDKLANFDS
jgi:hypothetical protein